MAIQMWTPDRTADLAMEGGSALARGISGGTKSLADSLTSAMEQRKQENVRAKASESLFNSTPELQQALNVDPETFKGMSSAEKNELVRAGLGKLTLMETLRAQAQQREMQNMREVEYSKQRAGEAGFNSAVAGMQNPGLMDVFKAGAQNNQLTTPNFDNLLRSLEAGQPAESFVPGTTTPVPNAARPGTVLIQTGPKQWQTQEPMKPDETDQPKVRMGFGEVDMWGGYPNQVTLTPDQYDKHKGALEKMGFKMQQEASGAWGGSAAAGKPLPLPKVKTELKAGQLYETSRGVAKWDGTKFIAQ